MNSHDFINILKHPQAITPHQTDDVKSIIDQFPYFQSARAIYLKGLKNQESFKYNQALKTTAAYTTDRSILFDFITSEAFVQNEISQIIKQNKEHLKDIDVAVEDISINKSVNIDHPLKQQIKDTEGVLDPALFQPKTPIDKVETSFALDDTETIKNVSIENQTPGISAETILSLGKPLVFDKKETHSFSEWLNLTRFKPIQREVLNKKTEPKPDVSTAPIDTPEQQEKAKKFKLIDAFITKNPKIAPTRDFTSTRNLAKDQMIQPETLMTETLARIYVEQNNYKKAIQSYKILSLKYPEKSSSFAIQIKAIEHLQEQNK
jgi:hypothetical protein